MKMSFFLQLCCLLVSMIVSVRLPAQVGSEKVDFTKADSIAALYPGYSLNSVKLLSNRLTGSLTTDVEKFRAIYKWVCDNIENDYGNFTKFTYKKKKFRDRPEEFLEWNKHFSHSVMEKLRKEHKTVCTGYALLVKELAYHAGLNCKVIDGYGKTSQSNIGGEGEVNHSWNAVRLNDRWYLCDPTWSSGIVHPDKGGFIPNFSEAYFLTNPTLFALNHYPLDTAWLLMKNKPALSEFLNGPLVYKSALSRCVYPIFPETFDVKTKKVEPLQFCFKSEKPIDPVELKLQIVKGSESRFANAYARQDPDGMYIMENEFTRRGVYVVHIMLEDKYLITYTVHVGQ